METNDDNSNLNTYTNFNMLQNIIQHDMIKNIKT